MLHLLIPTKYARNDFDTVIGSVKMCMLGTFLESKAHFG